MPLRIEDYALIGDCHTGALVGNNGSIDWLSIPRFDSAACFAALLGTPEHGHWQIVPDCEIREVRRWYHGHSLVLETEFETDHGVVSIIDSMPLRSREHDIVRLVVGKRGQVPMKTELVIRFDYGSIVPWVRSIEGNMYAVAGPDRIRVCTPVDLHGEDLKTLGEFTVSEGQRIPFVFAWYPSHNEEPPMVNAEAAITETESWWNEWAGQCKDEGTWCDAVKRSLVTLKALTYAPTGGMVAALTTSLPERLGGVRNWDYRFCWIRDATFTLYALMNAGYIEEARDWREWLLRAVAGTPDQLQMIYGVAGERRLTELTLGWLPGYEASAPVRIGNDAYSQFQLDVYGEVMDALHVARARGLQPDENAWRVQKALMQHMEKVWHEPDEGIWEVRGPRRCFTHSKVMAWVAMDRAVKAVERFGLDGPVDQWRRLRQTIHDQVCRDGFDSELNSFVQYYGSKDLDASVLMIPLVGFLPADDPRMVGTIGAIQTRLSHNGFVYRYSCGPDVDGLPHGEGTFLLCTFWLADNLALLGRHDEARELFERLLALRNDVGLLAEEYDPHHKRLLGNFPQAFSHIALINTAFNLERTERPAEQRPQS